MRKTIIVFLLVFAFVLSNAQEKEELGKIPAGLQFVKAGFNFSNSKIGDDKSTSFSILPVYGRFVAPNLSFAIGIGYNSSKSEIGNTTTNDSNGVTFLGLSRQYKHVAKPFYIFLQEDVSFSTSNDKISDVKTTAFGLGLSPGFNYFMSDHVSIDVTLGRLGYGSSKSDVSDSESINNFDLGFDMFNVGFGILYTW